MTRFCPCVCSLLAETKTFRRNLSNSSTCTESQAICKSIGSLGLDIGELRGQCYDGCASMSSLKKGLAGRILEHAPKDTYTHCNSLILSLSIAAGCNANNILHVLATMKDIAVFV